MIGLFSWIKNIACFMILISIIGNLLPNSKYEKYMKLYLGILLILILVSPLTKLFHIEDIMVDFFEKENLKMELEDSGFQLELIEASKYESLKKEYQNGLYSSLENFLKEKELYLVHANIVWNENTQDENFGKVETITLVVSKEEKQKPDAISVDKVVVSVSSNLMDSSQEENSLKNELGNFYNLPADNINISIRGGEGS